MNRFASDPFQAIADPSRRQILALLSKDSMSINALAGNFDMSRPAVSKHIKMLYAAGFIAIEDKGRERYCSLQQEGFRQLQAWINHFDEFWVSNVGKLQQLLNESEHPAQIRGKK
jgi:DNA-binding transcriptional ArsR family regulator